MSSTGPWLRPLETEATPVLHTTSCGKDRFNTDFSALRSIEDRTHASSTSDSKRVSHPSTLLAQSSSTLVINCKLGPLVTSSGELMNNLRNCHLVWSGQVLPPGRVVKEVLQVSVVEAVVGRDVVGMPLLVVLGRTVLAAEHRRASLRQVRNKKTKNTKQTNFFRCRRNRRRSTEHPRNEWRPSKIFSPLSSEKNKNGPAPVSREPLGCWPRWRRRCRRRHRRSRSESLGLLCRYSYRPSATAAADAMPASENHDDSLELEI